MITWLRDAVRCWRDVRRQTCRHCGGYLPEHTAAGRIHAGCVDDEWEATLW